MSKQPNECSVLSVGGFSGQGESNTCLHRTWALEELCGNLDRIDTSSGPVDFCYKAANRLFNYGLPAPLPDRAGANKKIMKAVEAKHYDIVWIDKGITVKPATLAHIKKVSPQTVIVSYSPDNMAMRHNQSRNYLKCLPLYDYVFTNKSYILKQMEALGAGRVYFFNNGYESRFHHPRELSAEDCRRLGGEVGFVGVWEKERCDSILYLADHGIKVRVFGTGAWRNYKDYSRNLRIEDKTLQSDDYCKSLAAFKISLCFLRKMNDDRQTTRTMEIPACGGFMLAERTDEHLALFEEGIQAAFFSSDEELLEKCRYYLAHDDERRQIAAEGHRRCVESDYSNKGLVKAILEKIELP